MESAEQRGPLTHEKWQRHLKNGGAERPPAAVGSLHRARFMEGFEDLCVRLSAACTDIFPGRRISVHRTQAGRAEERTSFAGDEAVVARFRVFQERFAVRLPVELVQHLLELLEHRHTDAMLHKPEETDLAALSYFLARLVSRADVFGNQRVYLISVNCISGGELEAAVNVQMNPAANIGLSVRIEDSVYSGAMLFSTELVGRISCYLDVSITAAGLSRLALGSLRWRVTVSELMLPAADLLHIDVGRRIALPGSGTAAAACELHAADPAAKAAVKTELRLESRKGVCKFHIGESQ